MPKVAPSSGAERPPAPRTAAELVEFLSALDPDTVVLVDGYEGGYSPIHLISAPQTMQEVAGRSGWYGKFETVEEAARLAAMEPGSRALAGDPPPTRAGEPIQAVVLHRAKPQEIPNP